MQLSQLRMKKSQVLFFYLSLVSLQKSRCLAICWKTKHFTRLRYRDPAHPSQASLHARFCRLQISMQSRFNKALGFEAIGPTCHGFVANTERQA